MNHHNAPIIEVKTFIAGVDAADLSDTQVFNKIAALEKELKAWEAISARPAKLELLMKNLKEDIAKLVKYVDNRE